MEPGIYFDMPNETYQQDPALGSTDHKRCLVKPVQWQAKRLDALVSLGMEDAAEEGEDKTDTWQKQLGRAYHVALLEGWPTFEATYATPMPKPDGLLKTKDEMNAALRELGVFLKAAEAKPSYEAACREKGLPLYDDWEPDYGGREVISEKWWARIRYTEHLMNVPRASRKGMSIRQHMLTGGAAEVSVFWTCEETGVPCKARFDYLRAKAIIDLKTFASREDEEIAAAFTRACQSYAYDMQAAHYLQGWAAAQAALREWRCYTREPMTEAQAKLCGAIAKREEPPQWTWLGVSTTGLPEVEVFECKAPIVLGAGEAMVMQARRRVAELREQFGDDQLWVEDRPIIPLEDASFPSYITARGEQRWRQ